MYALYPRIRVAAAPGQAPWIDPHAHKTGLPQQSRRMGPCGGIVEQVLLCIGKKQVPRNTPVATCPTVCLDSGETSSCQPPGLPGAPEVSRRRFLELWAATIAAPAVLLGCNNDDPTGVSGGTGDAGTSGGPGSSGPGSLTTSASQTGTSADDSTGQATTDDGSSTGDPEPTDDGGEEFPFDPGSVAQDDINFPRTVISGEMKASSVLLAIYIEDTQPKTLRFWRDSDVDGNVVLVREETVTPDADGFVKVPVEGLLPGTWYNYAYFGDRFETRSLIGRVRTAISATAQEVVTVAFAACNGGYYQPGAPGTPFTWGTMTAQAEQEYDLMIHLGDQGYMDDVFAAGGSYELYLEAWGGFHEGGYRAVFPKTGLYATWDDHEVTDNGSVNPWSRSASDIERIENAIRSFYTVMPIEGSNSMDNLWRSFRWGETVEFIILDSRYERSAQAAGLYISQPQMDFLKERLANSPCRFKVVCNSVPFTDLAPWVGFAAGDRWKGYPQQRQEIIDYVNDEDIRNVYWVTGDIHADFVSYVQTSPGPGAGDLMREVCVTSGNSNPVAFLLQGAQFDYSSGEPRVLIMTFDPNDESVNVRFLDSDGAVAHEQTLVSEV